MIVKIKRQRTPDSAPYWQSFAYNGPMHVTISAVLDAINYTDDLFDTETSHLDMEHIEKCAYTCHVCEKEFTANIHYSLEYSEITY